jgi:DNA processing protein
MTDEQEMLAWMRFGRTPGLNAAALRAALEALGSPAAVAGASPCELERAAVPAAAAAFLASGAAPPRAAERRWLESARHHLVPFTDPRYPSLLRSLADPPVILYASGDLGALSTPLLAVIGSRQPSAQGRETAAMLAEALCERGLGVASGLAEGIDACAHQGALRAQGITLAVLGCGIDVVYPRAAARLRCEVESWGALISEFPLGTPPRRGNFPQRNRIIAGLSLGTLVVEAARHSGSLITARLAKSLGRPVFAIPGSIHNPLARGCHELIKAGAKLVDGVDDIWRGLNFSALLTNGLAVEGGVASTVRSSPTLDKDRKILLDALGFDLVDLDLLVVRTGFKPEAVSSMMLILELEGHVQAAPGGRYSRVADRRAGGERQRSGPAHISLRELYERGR